MKKEIKWDVLATIFVGFMSALIAWEANKIGDLQAQIAVNNSLPNIQVDERQVYDESIGQVVGSTLEISNLEGRLSNFHASVVSVIEFTYSEIGEEYYCVKVPINSYYFWNSISGINNGVIETKSSLDNFLKIQKLKEEVRSKNTADDVLMAMGMIESYIEITYNDLLGNDRAEYYCSNVITTYRLDETEGKEIFQSYKNLIDEGYYIDPNWTEKLDAEAFCDLAYCISKLDINLQGDKKAGLQKEGGISMKWEMTDVLGLVIALFSLCVAVRAMKLQHKSIVFKNRLEIYTEIERLYKNCICIIQKSKIIENVYNKKRFIASCMFGINDEEYSVVSDALEQEKKRKAKKGNAKKIFQEDWARLLGTYSDLYIKKYLYSDIESRINLFFSKIVAEKAMKVYKCYDELRLGIILFEEDELIEQICLLQESIEEFEKHKILKKMKRELPVR